MKNPAGEPEDKLFSCIPDVLRVCYVKQTLDVTLLRQSLHFKLIVVQTQTEKIRK